MKDVADRVGVSISTVSHVLNQTRYVETDLANRVHEAVESLGYQLNAVARGLRRRETRMIGMVVPDNSNPYFAELARSIEDACFKLGYNVILCNSDEDPAKERAYLSLLAEKRVDGVIFVDSGGDPHALESFFETNAPVVVLDRKVKDVACDSIVVDNQRGGRLATSHLIRGGHTRIGCICGPTKLSSAKERLQGYREVMEAADLPVDPTLTQSGDFHITGGYSAMNCLLDLCPGITAVFACNDLMALGALRAIAARDLQVPRDIAVVGFDGIALADYAEPPITTVVQPIRKMGQLATELVVSRVSGGSQPARHFSLKTKLVVRESCGIDARKGSRSQESFLTSRRSDSRVSKPLRKPLREKAIPLRIPERVTTKAGRTRDEGMRGANETA
jgi:LacI family transcriptional regulator